MAKLKAPLLSLAASGAIGKAIVYFGWKGINVAREYVVPSNPKTTPQVTQRGYLHAAVDAIHAAQALAASPLGALDSAAMALWGSCWPTPRTWFNQIVKNWLNQKRLTLIPSIFRGGVLTPSPTEILFKLLNTEESSAITNGTVNWGTSKTALINSQAVTAAEIEAGIAITGMVTKTKYFLQFRPTLPVGFIGSYSGIYYATTT